MTTIIIAGKRYKVKEALTEDSRRKGLLNIDSLPQDEGMLFYFDPPELKCSFWMKDTKLHLDIIFLNEELEVISVQEGIPYSELQLIANDVSYVLEVNYNSGIKVGDKMEFADLPVMKVLASDGTSQYELWGGERIISRKETKVIIRKAKKADLSKDNKDYKALGKYIFKVIKGLDNREPEYVKQ